MVALPAARRDPGGCGGGDADDLQLDVRASSRRSASRRSSCTAPQPADPRRPGRRSREQIEGATFVALPGADYGVASATPTADRHVEEFLTGAPAPRDADRVLVDRAVHRHRRLDRARVSSWATRSGASSSSHRARRFGGGTAIRRRRSGFTGDGSSRPSTARHGQSDARRAARRVRLGLQIRAGLHTGEIELAASDRRHGRPHRRARVGNAGPGEVLVSPTVKDLVAGSGLVFADRGAHQLKGVPDQWQLFAASGLASVSARSTTLDCLTGRSFIAGRRSRYFPRPGCWSFAAARLFVAARISSGSCCRFSPCR